MLEAGNARGGTRTRTASSAFVGVVAFSQSIGGQVCPRIGRSTSDVLSEFGVFKGREREKCEKSANQTI
jgi:hypothetical protein